MAVETTFYAECNGENLQVVVDLSAVNFLASLGIRLLVQGLKSVKARNGKDAWVPDGLALNSRVVVYPDIKLKEGAKVKVR